VLQGTLERVYALMGFFKHRADLHFQETEVQALGRLSMANDNDRITEGMISSASRTPDTARWYAEQIMEPEIQVVGITNRELGGCRAATVWWKDFPSVSFAMRPSSYRRLPPKSFLVWIILETVFG